ncbi:hypothetical protein FSP39_001854 [Pinctada imbricata]|uniref:Transmembrane protein 53 n=1 Tax=Pinctada imbricata TaxID=66713 RepID=A0AA88Y6Z7_PINIB|nr:hypothetical protein FSP39_001854 [Pinctada imbricata]
MKPLPSKGITETTIRPYGFQLRVINSGNIKSKTLVIFFGWLYAPVKALEMYFSLYHMKGYDVLFIPGLLKHFAWPPYSMELAKHFLDYISNHSCDYEHYFIHGTSIGAYNYTSCLMLAGEEPNKFSDFFTKLRGIVFDSITCGSEQRMITGVSHGLTKNRFIRWLIPNTLSLYFALFPETTVKFFANGVQYFQEHPAKVPSLFYYSKNDPMCDAELLDELISKWNKNMPFPVMHKCWARSPHAGHFIKYKDEYLSYHDQFMKMCETSSKL